MIISIFMHNDVFLMSLLSCVTDTIFLGSHLLLKFSKFHSLEWVGEITISSFMGSHDFITFLSARVQPQSHRCYTSAKKILSWCQLKMY